MPRKNGLEVDDVLGLEVILILKLLELIRFLFFGQVLILQNVFRALVVAVKFNTNFIYITTAKANQNLNGSSTLWSLSITSKDIKALNSIRFDIL